MIRTYLDRKIFNRRLWKGRRQGAFDQDALTIPFFPQPRNVASSTLFPFAMITEEQSYQVNSEDSSCIGTLTSFTNAGFFDHLIKTVNQDKRLSVYYRLPRMENLVPWKSDKASFEFADFNFLQL